MKCLFSVVLSVIMVITVNAQEKKKESGFDKLLRVMFPSTKPKVVEKKRKHAKQKTGPIQVPKQTSYVPVEIDWMARYWENEAAWDYYIPEDDRIRFENGKYLVPIVVYKHYEDMVNTPRRTPTPVPPKLEG